MVISKGYFQAYLNSIIVSVCSVAISVLISTMIGFALAKYNFKGKEDYFCFCYGYYDDTWPDIPDWLYAGDENAEAFQYASSSDICMGSPPAGGFFLMTQFISDGVPDELFRIGTSGWLLEPGIFFGSLFPV